MTKFNFIQKYDNKQIRVCLPVEAVLGDESGDWS